MMEQDAGYSPFHWIIMLVAVAVIVIPYVKIIRKAGFSGWWVITVFIPLVNLIMLWVFAFVRWPIENKTG
jgi:hypothetical protein